LKGKEGIRRRGRSAESITWLGVRAKTTGGRGRGQPGLGVQTRDSDAALTKKEGAGRDPACWSDNIVRIKKNGGNRGRRDGRAREGKKSCKGREGG